MIASQQRQKGIVCVLIENGADVNYKDTVSIRHFVDISFTMFIADWRNSFISSLSIWKSRNSIHFDQKQSFIKLQKQSKLEYILLLLTKV